ncbi:MAG TPA: signal peptidase II [Phenylobacterium sp.]|jgi:signal peptidase II
MNRITKLGVAAFGLAVLVVVADQAVKYWVLEVLRLQEGQSLPFLGPIRLTGVWNPGVSFGFLQAQHDLVRWALAAFSVGVAIMLAFWVRRTERPLFAVAVGMVMGGAVGNVIDRIRFGAVADFVDASRLRFPWVFNVADSAITVGICLLLLDMLLQDGRERSDRASKAVGEDAA